MASLPWNITNVENEDLTYAKTILDRDHFGLEAIKQRILQSLAVRLLNQSSSKNGSVLCLVGPPGVGKTSIGKSIAEALGRKSY